MRAIDKGRSAVGRESEAHPAFCICKSRFDIMPSRGEIRVHGRQCPDAMQVIGQNDHGLDRERSTVTGRLEPSPKIVKVFGQEFPAAFQQGHREKERASWKKGANVLRHDFSLIPLLKAGCASLSRPTATA
jgi:hypothetical protein